MWFGPPGESLSPPPGKALSSRAVRERVVCFIRSNINSCRRRWLSTCLSTLRACKHVLKKVLENIIINMIRLSLENRILLVFSMQRIQQGYAKWGNNRSLAWPGLAFLKRVGTLRLASSESGLCRTKLSTYYYIRTK